MAKYFAVDVETSTTNFEEGSPKINKLLQLSYVILDEDLKELIRKNFYVKYDIDEIDEIVDSMNDYVKVMHTCSGLIDNLKDTNKVLDLVTIEVELTNDIKNSISYPSEKIIPVGNNVEFDLEVIRRYFKKASSMLHYSSINVSAVRKTMDIAFPGIAAMSYGFKNSNHDSLVDIEECIKEFKTYLRIFKYSFNEYSVKEAYRKEFHNK